MSLEAEGFTCVQAANIMGVRNAVERRLVMHEEDPLGLVISCPSLAGSSINLNGLWLLASSLVILAAVASYTLSKY